MTLKSNNVAILKDANGRHSIEVEVNRNNKIEDFVEFRVKDEKGEWIKSYIKIKELYGLIFMIVGEEQQSEMMPIRKTEVREYVRQQRIKLKKDMKKGEIVVVNYTISVPIIVEENLRGLIKRKSVSPSSIIIPRRY